ncbi:MAG: radical SAM protein [Peptococcaceae bacterium]|jgi:MoaA/NifB/PqqE/SkfB family radical SAM enzyme|nr:radical SAM protein [Peptococcaceae bacterium]
MKSINQTMSSIVMRRGMNYIEKNPERNIPRMLKWAERIARKKEHKQIIRILRDKTQDKNYAGYQLFLRTFLELKPKVRSKFFINYLLQEVLIGNAHIQSMREKHQCNIPYQILLDPTSACNLKCTGCWAQEYDKSDNLDLETIDRIICEGKELGIYSYLYSGGEPLLRRKDIIELAKKHSDCMFLAFTNATLIDEEFCRQMEEVGNLILAISVEGFEQETDMRRGVGTYQKIMQAMDLLKQHGLGFGFSTCYHRRNTDVVGSDEYIDLMIEKGCMFGWYFTYMPLGKDAVLELLATPEQREYMYHRIREIRSTKPIFLLDFWNDGEYINGCVAGGRYYLHINAAGDVEPCAFIHYSNYNIKNMSLIEALKSPLFKQYAENQPFNSNHLRPCPLLDNPEKLRAMVKASQAVSTQPLDKEDIDILTAKCEEPARNWAPVADKLWEKHLAEKEKQAGIIYGKICGK